MVIPRRVLFLILLAVVVVAAVGYSLWRSPAGAVRFSINRSVIKKDENATITVTFENVHRQEYVVEYRFKVSSWVVIYEGSARPLPLVGAQYTFNYSLGATVPSDTRLFDVIGDLEEGVSSATYPISLTIVLDGEELEKTWNDIALKVEG